jgi:hypothetical protein
MSTKRSVILKGRPQISEEGKASATVKPGYLVKGVGTVAHQSYDGAVKVPAAFALERDELGTGIDNAHQGSGTISAFYASGDQVKVGVFKPGDEVTAFIASGENIAEDDLLSSAGDGTLEETDGSDYVVARAMEALGLIAAVTACRVQII